MGKKIIYVGNKASAVNNFAGETIEVDLQGKTMLPGFLGSHGHFMSAIMMVNQVNVASLPVGTGWRSEKRGLAESLSEKGYQFWYFPKTYLDDLKAALRENPE